MPSHRKPLESNLFKAFLAKEAWDTYLQASVLYRETCRRLESSFESEKEFYVPGWCVPCEKQVNFGVDAQYAYQLNGKRYPNWREQLSCPDCKMNNRMRAALHMLQLVLTPECRERGILIAEQTTPIFTWITRHFPVTLGFEYLGQKTPYGCISKQGIRNETLNCLTFNSGSFGIALCFDVLEHIQNYRKALTELHRVLVPGGSVIITVPFRSDRVRNLVRALTDENGTIRHLLPPEYHGDPLEKAGCLAFYHFGWEFMNDLRDSGFSMPTAYQYWSDTFGYLGADQFIFIARKEQ